jgi:hypothetical protein
MYKFHSHARGHRRISATDLSPERVGHAGELGVVVLRQRAHALPQAQLLDPVENLVARPELGDAHLAKLRPPRAPALVELGSVQRDKGSWYIEWRSNLLSFSEGEKGERGSAHLPVCEQQNALVVHLVLVKQLRQCLGLRSPARPLTPPHPGANVAFRKCHREPAESAVSSRQEAL